MSRQSVRRELLARWSSLSGDQQVFLRCAAERDRTLPHSEGLSKVLPLMNWREIGASCGFSDPVSDELVHALAAAKIVLLDNPNQHTFGLLAGYLVDEVDAAERDRWWKRVEVVAVVASVLVALAYVAMRRAE
jgi:hypothetical protein